MLPACLRQTAVVRAAARFPRKQRLQSGGDLAGRLERVFPYSIDSPALSAKNRPDFLIAALVAGDFRIPVPQARLGHPAMSLATVPEAPIDEHSEALVAKKEVGSAEKRLMAAPASDAMSAEDGGQLQLGIFVARRADGSHDLRARRPRRVNLLRRHRLSQEASQEVSAS